jgi:hypothetical protein
VLALPTVAEASALLYLAALVTAAGFVLWYSACIGAERAGLFAGLIPRSRAADAAALPPRAVGSVPAASRGLHVSRDVGWGEPATTATTPPVAVCHRGLLWIISSRARPPKAEPVRQVLRDLRSIMFRR